MRVPNVLQGAEVFSELGRIRSEINRHSQEIASGRRVNRPSDDPLAASNASRAASRLDDVEHFRNATDHARSELFAVDEILDTMERLMDEAASVAAAGRSGTTTPEGFTALSQQVEGLRQEMLRLANSTHQGAFLFGGRRTLAPPFVESLGVVGYQGDGVAPSVRVGEQAVVETSIPGSNLFVSSLDVFQVLTDLRNGLTAQDTAAVATAAGSLETVASRFTQFRVRTGLALEELDRHSVRLGELSVQEKAEIGRNVDADLVESITRLNARSTALEAALGAGARIISISLMDVLG